MISSTHKPITNVIVNNIIEGGGGSGGSSTSNITALQAAEDLSGGLLVYYDVGLLKYNNTDENLYGLTIGFTNQSGLLGEDINIITSGECAQMGGLISGKQYYAFTDGLITDIPPTTGIFQPVGIAKNATTLIVNFQKPYIKI